MLKKFLVLAVTVVAMLSFSVAAMAVEVEHRAYAELPSTQSFVDSRGSYEYELTDYDFSEGVVLGYEAMFATSVDDLRITLGANFFLGTECANLDIYTNNIYGGLKYQVADHKLQPYLIGRLGLALVDVDSNSYEDENFGLYTGFGVGIKPTEHLDVELLYLYGNSKYTNYYATSAKGEFTSKRLALSVGYTF